MIEKFSSHETEEANKTEQYLKTVTDFIDDKLDINYQLINDGNKSQVYECFKTEVDIDATKKALFVIDYIKYKQGSLNNRVRFGYALNNKSKNNPLFAAMVLKIQNLNTFELIHRHVEPEYRKNLGVGTRLLKEVEKWVEEVAKAEKHAIEIIINTGQTSVIKWAQKNEYTVKPGDERKFKAFSQNPNDYVIEDIIDSDGRSKPDYIFEPNTETKISANAVRFTFEKIINPTE